jgi:hypothetical protein
MIGTSTRKDEALDRLTDGIAELTSSDTWRSWLVVQARFHRYSFSNSVLIFAQHPSATRVAGFRTWRQLGRQVQRGQQAIWILAPVTRRVQERADATDLEPPTRTVVAFRAVPVFAEDQTSGAALPEVCRRLSGDDPHGLYAALVEVAHSIGFSVADHAFEGETNGSCSPQLRRIRVEERLSPAHRVKTLAHELAHALLHSELTAERGLMELEAESVAFVVCDALGIASDDWTFGYVMGWSGGGEAAIATIKTVGGRIQRTGDRILSALDQEEPGRLDRASAAEP